MLGPFSDSSGAALQDLICRKTLIDLQKTVTLALCLQPSQLPAKLLRFLACLSQGSLPHSLFPWLLFLKPSKRPASEGLHPPQKEPVDSLMFIGLKKKVSSVLPEIDLDVTKCSLFITQMILKRACKLIPS